MACHDASLVQVDGCGNLLAVVLACERGCVDGACCPLGTVVKGGECVKYDPGTGAGGWCEDAGGGKGGDGGADGGDVGGSGEGTADTTGWSNGAAEPPAAVAATSAGDGCESSGGSSPPTSLLLLVVALALTRRRPGQPRDAA
jgi:MYXO-CTERM domain-containing protein